MSHLGWGRMAKFGNGVAFISMGGRARLGMHYFVK